LECPGTPVRRTLKLEPRATRTPEHVSSGPRTPGWFSSPVVGGTPQRLSTPIAGHSPLVSLVMPPSSPSLPGLQGASFLELPVSCPPRQAIEHVPEVPRWPDGGEVSPRYESPLSDSLLKSPSEVQVPQVPQEATPRTPAVEWPPLDVLAQEQAPRTPAPLRCEKPQEPSSAERASSPAASSEAAFTPGGSPQSQGIGIILEFLTAVLDTACRSVDQLHRHRCSADADSEQRAMVRLQLLEALFVDTDLMPHLFELIRGGGAQFEAASLLHGLLQRAPDTQKGFGVLARPFLAHCSLHVETLGTLLCQLAPKPCVNMKAPQAQPNSYTVQEPLGSLRVLMVQILADLCSLAPQRVVLLIKPAVWELLVHWFRVYRCNHIFQAACSVLIVTVVRHGGAKLQAFVFVKLGLLREICDTVLAEGACGDAWHDLHSTTRGGDDAHAEKACIAVRRKRHPGGLGGITPVVTALAAAAAAAATGALKENAAEVSEGHSGANVAERRPLALRALQTAPLAREYEEIGSEYARTRTKQQDIIKPTQPVLEKSSRLNSSCWYMGELLATTDSWPQVLCAVQVRSAVCAPVAALLPIDAQRQPQALHIARV